MHTFTCFQEPVHNANKEDISKVTGWEDSAGHGNAEDVDRKMGSHAIDDDMGKEPYLETAAYQDASSWSNCLQYNTQFDR